MRVYKDTPFEFGFLSWRVDPPRISTLIVLKATFDLVPEGPCPLAEAQRPTEGEILYEDAEEPSARCDSDFALRKPEAEWWLSGYAYAPRGEPLPLLRVSAKIGEQEEKVLAVHGDRRWERRSLRTRPSEAAPFARMPLRWERSFGGHGHSQNPAGAGLDPVEQGKERYVPLPNIEDPKAPIASFEDRPRPAGFAPIPLTWPARMGKAGTYDERWQRERWPWYPEDFDYGYFNSAPPDQRQAEPFRGDESLRLQGLHPEHESLRCRLPGLVGRCFVEWEPEEEAPQEGGEPLDEGLEREFDEDALTLVRGGGEGPAVEGLPGRPRILRVVSANEAEQSREEIDEEIGEEIEEGAFDDDEETSQYLEGNAAEILVHDFDEEFVEDEATRAIRSGVFRTEGITDDDEEDEENSALNDLNDLDDFEGLEDFEDFEGEATFALGASAASRAPSGASAEPEEATAIYVPRQKAGAAEEREALRARLREQIPRPRLVEVPLSLDTLGIDTEAGQVRCIFRGLLHGMPDEQMGGVRRLFFAHDSLEDPALEGEGEEDRRERHEARLHELLIEEALEGALDEGREPPDAEAYEPADPPDPFTLHPKVERARAAVAALYQTMGEIFGEGPITANAGELKARVEAEGELPEELAALEDPLPPPPEEEIPRSLRRLAILVLYMRSRSARGFDLSGAPFAGLKLPGMDLTGALLAGASLEGADLSGATLDGASLAEADLRGARLDGASLLEADLRAAKLGGARMREVKLGGADLRGAELEGARLRGADLRGASLEEASLREARLPGAHLEEAELEGADLERANLQGAFLAEASLEGVRARGALFDGADLRELRASTGGDFEEASLLGVSAPGSQWQGSSLRGAKLGGADLKGADLSEASLEGASLDRVDLRGARLAQADLRGASLKESDLFEASLDGADLRGADLRGANLFGAGLFMAKTEGAELEGADLGRTLLAEGQIAGQGGGES